MATPSSKLDSLLDKLYYDPKDPGSYGGVERVLNRAHEKGVKGANRQNVSKFITEQQAYSLHKP